MSYIRAKKVNPDEGPDSSLDIRVYPEGNLDLDRNLDDEALSFVRDLIAEIDELGEGEALVVWKEIF